LLYPSCYSRELVPEIGNLRFLHERKSIRQSYAVNNCETFSQDAFKADAVSCPLKRSIVSAARVRARKLAHARLNGIARQ